MKSKRPMLSDTLLVLLGGSSGTLARYALTSTFRRAPYAGFFWAQSSPPAQVLASPGRTRGRMLRLGV